MKKNKKQIIMITSVLVIVGVFVFVAFKSGMNEFIKADSGWDSSYDSGGWSGGFDSGDWDSSSSWSDYDSYDSGYSHSSSGSHSSADPEDSVFLIMILILIGYLIYINFVLKIRGDAKNEEGHDEKVKSDFIIENQIYKSIDQEKLSKILPGYDLKKLSKLIFDNFVEIQMAWMNFDYEKLKKYCSDELFNTYKSQLETLKLKNGQNIMKEFVLNNISIYYLDEKDGKITMSVYMNTSFYDYVIDTKTNKVTRGTDKRKLTNNYLLTYVKSKEDVSPTTCPNCGASLKNTSSQVCEYCRSKIVKLPSDFVLTQKRNLN